MILPRIKVNRLYVLTNQNRVAYDERFHSGINIIRGENSSGKSTIMQLLFFALGGAFKNFVPQAKKCRDVYVEVYLNEIVYTFCRRLELNKNDIINDRVGMEIHWGPLDKALEKKCPMENYGYNSTSNCRSFSNVIFELLGIPEVKEESNITMHQLLRLVYIDQESPTNSLFFYEQFDTQNQREAIADLLLGSYDPELYQLIEKIKEEQKRLELVNTKIKGLEIVLQSSRDSYKISKEVKKKEEEIKLIDDEICLLMKEFECVQEDETIVNTIKEKVKRIRIDLLKKEELLKDLENEIYDTESFIHELEKKKKDLEDSLKIRHYLDSLTFEYCPICLSKLEDYTEPGHCKLCHNPIDDERGMIQAQRMILEISFQIKESKNILQQNKEMMNDIYEDYLKQKVFYEDEKNKLNSYLKNVQSSNDERITNCYYRKGLAQGELLQYKTLLEMAEKYERYKQGQFALDGKVTYLKKSVAAQKRIRDKFREDLLDRLKENGIWILKNDLQRENDFNNAEDFNINFADNSVYVLQNKSRYSASSNFYLKLAARFSIFLTSLEENRMRFPRFLFSDNMEDKGMEEDRAKNMQRIIVEKLKNFNEDDYQLIFATSMIADELDNDKYTIGEKYTSENKSLKNV